jgi:hypothetical protein
VIKGFRVQKDGSILYPDTVQTVPRHRKNAFNERCFQMIDYHNGDEILQTGLSRGLFSFLIRNIGVFNYSRSWRSLLSLNRKIEETEIGPSYIASFIGWRHPPYRALRRSRRGMPLPIGSYNCC